MNDRALISSQLRKVIDLFPRIQLEDLPEGAQMERIDRKFPFHISKVPQVLEGMHKSYSILKAAGSVISPYDSHYFDTADFTFFRKHHSGFLNRDKIRYRSYPRTDTTFLEVKTKSNKGRTAKSRVLCSGNAFPLEPSSLKFLSNSVKLDPSKLIPSVSMKYNRMAFIGENDEERFSIDFDISSELGDKKIDFGDVAILEVKQDQNFTSPIIARLRSLGIREASMSKYCLALCMLNPNLKANRFKSDIRRLEKIIYEEN